MQALQSQINNFFSQFINPLPHTSIYEYFVMAHIFESVSVDVAFYLMLGFETQGHGFESTSLFWGDMGLSLQLCFWGVVGLSPFLWGVGFFLILFGLDGGGFTLIS